MRKYTLSMLVLSVAFIGYNLAQNVGNQSPWLILAMAVVLAQYIRISAIAMPRLGVGAPRRWEIPATLAVALTAWWSSLTTTTDFYTWSLLPACILGAIASNRTGPARWWSITIGSAFIAVSGLAVAGASGVATPSPAHWIYSVMVVTMWYAGINVVQVWLWSVLTQLDDARRLAADLAVAEERLRFSAELHDVQGHHLQAIALKGELAERLIGHDDAAARVQAAAVSDLARQALRETREVVHGYRKSCLITEIRNAVDILRAAGIAATVDGSAATVPPPLQPLFGALVREGTTNILRHSTARECDLSLTVVDGTARVRMSNDGATAVGGHRGSGIESLHERFTAIGGAIRVEGTDGRFDLIGEAAFR
jgi:two-component system sensor histidine kinase DesK